MYYTYILKSNQNNKYYIGSSSDLSRRLIEHNSGKVKSTRANRPWSIYYFEEFNNEKEAILRERRIKRWKSRKMVEKLKLSKIEDPRFRSQIKDLNEIGTGEINKLYQMGR